MPKKARDPGYDDDGDECNDEEHLGLPESMDNRDRDEMLSKITEENPN
jgi:hypothetical protein